MSTCADCKRRRDTFSIRREGGGSYKRGGRSYSSSICAECAVVRLAYASVHAGATSGGYDVSSLAKIVARLANEADPERRDDALPVLLGHLDRLRPQVERRPYLADSIARLREAAGLPAVDADSEATG